MWNKNTHLSLPGAPQNDRKERSAINPQEQRKQERTQERATAVSEFEKMESRWMSGDLESRERWQLST